MSSKKLQLPANAATCRALVRALLAWFAAHARDLPWRRTRDPYAIWVSEIMLQQTQVKTVIPYWERWLRSLPNIQSLADAPPQTIHKLWEGLGYYTRVRNMQKAAQQIVAEHRGQFPDAFDSILALPGIGRYTAGAIASIAFNQPAPILDGNVIRVLTRLFGISGNPKDKVTNAKLWQLSEQLVTISFQTTAADTCSQLNQSLMELGALICTPKQPKCLACPVRSNCVAYRTGRTDEFPALAPRTAPTARLFAAFIIQNRHRYLVQQRPSGIVNAHLWEFPNFEFPTAPGASDLNHAAETLFGQAPQSTRPLCTVKHTITRYRITLTAFHAALPNAAPRAKTKSRWCTLAEMQKLPFPSAHQKILKHLAQITVPA